MPGPASPQERELLDGRHGPGTPHMDALSEARLAAVIHSSGILTGPIGPLAGSMVWMRTASPWMRRHLRDAFIHWIIVLALFAGAVALDTMNPVYDFGLVRVAAFSLGITRAYTVAAWITSSLFAAVSARRAVRGQLPLYPFTAWWSAPWRGGGMAGPVEVMEVDADTPPAPSPKTPAGAQPRASQASRAASVKPLAPAGRPGKKRANDAGPESFADFVRKNDQRR